MKAATCRAIQRAYTAKKSVTAQIAEKSRKGREERQNELPFAGRSARQTRNVRENA